MSSLRPQSDAILATAFTVVVLLAACPSHGRATPSLRESLSGTHRYDPAIRKAHLEQPPAKIVAPAPISRPASPSEPKPSAPTLVLPTMTVRGAQEKQTRSLPRLSTDEPVMNIPVEPFESKEGRRARLVKKHFTSLEQALGRMLGQNQENRAVEKEAPASAALQLNAIADLIDLSAMAGLDDPGELKKLRAEYLKAYHGRPR